MPLSKHFRFCFWWESFFNGGHFSTCQTRPLWHFFYTWDTFFYGQGSFLYHEKWPLGRFSTGVVIRRYTGLWRLYLSANTTRQGSLLKKKYFILRARRLSSKLLKQGYLVERLKSSFRKFTGQYGDLIQQYEVPLSRMLNDILTLHKLQWPPNQSYFS